MSASMMSLAAAWSVGIVSGADASIWGMYKDAAHEGFGWPRFFRSMLVGGFAAVALQVALALDLSQPSALLLLFGLAYAVERVIVEVWKTFVRNESQDKYAIPMQFALRGVPVRSRAWRLVAGVGYCAVLAVAAVLIARLDASGGSLRLAGVAGFLTGLGIAIGGAWKDAPIEGFETLKFFRSPALTTLGALLLFPVAESVLLAAVAAIGYERAASENYKTFCFPSRPRGKFAGMPVTHPDMLERRRWFVPAYVAIRVALIWLVAQAAASALTVA